MSSKEDPMSGGEEGFRKSSHVSGTTRLFAVLGHPVAQVMAPELMNALFAARGTDAVMLPVEASPEQFATVVEGLKAIGNLGGLLLTVPHKFAVLDHADHLAEAAAAAGSANALRREPDGTWTADNFDGTGFVAGAEEAGHVVRDRSIALVGAGGAGVSLAAALLRGGARHLWLTDAAAGRADGLARRLAEHWVGRVEASPRPRLASCDIAINATPAGLRPDDPLPFPVDDLPPHALVADIIMKPADTALLKAAAARGLRTHAGIHMLKAQVDLYRRFFRIP
jgi:shikimate dehydrogenase